jgi:hypothetical protein
VQRLSSVASAKGIGDFRAWLAQNKPLEAPESQFLDEDQDLIALGPSTISTSATMSTESASDLTALCILTMTLLPLLCFKFISGVLNRIILLVGLLAAGLSSLDKLDAKRKEHHRTWVLACCGVSFLVALLF